MSRSCTLFVLISIIIILLSSFLIYRISFTKSEVRPPKPWHDMRLSPSIKPTLYQLSLHPSLSTGVFHGKVTIFINVESPQSHISVHIKELHVNVSKLYLDNEEKTPIEIKDIFEYSDNEFWIIELKNELIPNRYKLYFEFNGKLINKMVGFYLSMYQNAAGERRRIATSKFEPTFARQAFPCFDEPGFKSKFKIELIKPSENEYIALSNMNQLEEQVDKPSKGLTTVTFNTTFPMSTYLACFIVCDFDHLETRYTNSNIPITVYARKEYISDVKFALDAALQFTDFYCNYFDIAYPLSKLDLIAIPDFVSGAMENWGLITFRETRLLCNEENSSVGTRLNVELTVAHEISHMWFGDLVTMKWWNDLWLNEGFATFMEYKAVADRYPTGEMDNVFIAKELIDVMMLDSTESSHPIILPVNNPDQITEIFDKISYNKGASIIRMLEMTVGPKEFRSAISSYLEKFRFSNAETNDLWGQLDLHSNNMNITLFMDTWTRQMGFPVISVTVDKKNNVAVFKQKRFLFDSAVTTYSSSSPYGYKWEVPITYITSYFPKTVQTVWLHKNDECISVSLEKNATFKWLKVNYHQIGYYVVNYEDWLWDELQAALVNNIANFDPPDRMNLLYDSFILSEGSQLSWNKSLKLTEYLPKETHFLPWIVGSRGFLTLHKRLYGTDAHEYFKKYVRYLIKDLPAINWNIDDRAGYTIKTLQVTILNLGCEVENRSCLHQARSLFKQWLSEPNMKLQPELATIIMHFGIQQSTEEEWDAMWNLYLKQNDPQEKLKIMTALCATQEPKLIEKYLQYGKNETWVRSQDYLSIIMSASNNPVANPIVWDFVRKEWEYLVKRYTLNDRYLGRIIPQIAGFFSTEMRLLQMKEFFQKYPEAGAGANGRKQALELVESNLIWRRKHLPVVTDWFKNASANFIEEDFN